MAVAATAAVWACYEPIEATPTLSGADAGAQDAALGAVQGIFDRSCAGASCHIGAKAPAQGLDLSPGVAIANLVGVESTEAPGKTRVVAGRPDESYLLCKVDPACADIAGSRMPLGGALSPADIAAIRAWIVGVDASSADKSPPAFAGLETATATSETSATLTWKPATDDVTAASDIVYRVFSGAAPGAEDFSSPIATVTGQTSATLAGLEPGTTRYFVARAVDKAGNQDANTVERSVSTVDATPPVFAGLASATAANSTSVTLSWSPAADNGAAAGQIRYRVYVATASGTQAFATPTLTTASGATSVTVTGLTTATSYFFVVRAVDTAGNEDKNTVERTATTADAVAPVFAGATSASPSANAVTLGWSAATDNVTPQNQLVYLVYQATTSGGQSFGTPTYTTPAGATSFAVGALAASTKYYFVVRARDAATNVDANSVEVSATTPAGSDVTAPTFAGASSATAASETSIDLSWPAASDNVTAAGSIVYLVYRATSAGGLSFVSPTYTTAPGATTFTATGLNANTTYFFVVRAKDQAGNIDTNTKSVSATTNADPTAPTFGGATSAIAQSASSISLSWAAATDNVSSAAQMTYLVYRAATSQGQSFATPTYTTSAGATSFVATGLSPSTAYFFVVRARDAAGNVDANTAQVSATTLAVSFASDVQPIFTSNCALAGCHSGALPQEGLGLGTASTSYTNLVNVASSKCGTTKRVAPSLPDSSYLVRKIAGSGDCFVGSQMPLGGAPLSASDQGLIRAWITAGAPNN